MGLSPLNISGKDLDLTPLPLFPPREWGFQSLSPCRGEVWRGVLIHYMSIVVEQVYRLLWLLFIRSKTDN